MDSEKAALLVVSKGAREEEKTASSIPKPQTSSPNGHICFHGFCGFHGYGNIDGYVESNCMCS